MDAMAWSQPMAGVGNKCLDSEESWRHESVSTGTTIMALTFSGGVVMAADTRTSMGQFVSNRVARKLTMIHDRIFVARSGSAADTQHISGYVIKFLGQNALDLGDLPRVNTAASLFQLLCYSNKDHLKAGLIVAGWDKREGGQVYQIPLGGSKLRVPYAVGGSGSGYISALLQELYREDMSEQEAVALVKKAVAYAIGIDSSSGGMVRVIVISEKDVKEEVVTNNDLPELPCH